MRQHESSTYTDPAPSLPATLRLGAVHLTVSDLDRSVAFYEEAIGLRLHRREGTVAAMGAGAEDLILLYEDPGARRTGRHAGLYHYALVYPSRVGRCGSRRRGPRSRVPPTTAPTRLSTYPTPMATASSWLPTDRASSGPGHWTTPARPRIALAAGSSCATHGESRYALAPEDPRHERAGSRAWHENVRIPNSTKMNE